MPKISHFSQVVAGIVDISVPESTAQISNVTSMVSNANFDSDTMENDIAVIELETPLRIWGSEIVILKIGGQKIGAAIKSERTDIV